uniref:Photosystem I reaction center subunit III n=1 Tax=Karenia brevis TaxID=156230 RepID=A0A0S2QDS2_KARBR|nr:photosystem I subunit F [Karenia brevis]
MLPAATDSRIWQQKFATLALSCMIFLPEKAQSSTPLIVMCKDSAAFNNLATTRLTRLNTALSNFEPRTPAYRATMERKRAAKNRFSRQALLMCGRNDGLPRLFSADLNTFYNSFAVPALQFLYIATCIGWAGREYLSRTANYKSEILIDLTLAATLMGSSPFRAVGAAWDDLLRGKLLNTTLQ